MELWGVAIQRHHCNLLPRARRQFPKSTGASGRKTFLGMWHLHQAVALRECLVATLDEKPGKVMTQVPAPPQAFKCEMSSEAGEMSNKPNQNRCQNRH